MKTYPFVTLCNAGFEDLVKDEIERLLKIKAKIGKTHVFFETTLEKSLFYIYRTQAAKQVLLQIGRFDASKDIAKQLETMNYNGIDGTFCLRCMKSSQEKKLGSVVYAQLKNPVVDLKNPTYTLYVHWQEMEGILGIDLAGDLSKRNYRIFAHPTSIKGTLAYFLVALSEYNGKGVFLDPCSGSGSIPAEAAFKVSSHPIRYYEKNELIKTDFFKKQGLDVKTILKAYDKNWKEQPKKEYDIKSYDVDLQAVNAAKKNFKIAGIEKIINPAKGDISWLDTKFEKQSVDYIVSNPPEFTKFTKKRVNKFYEAFFFHAEFVLKKKGTIVLLLNSKEVLRHAEKMKFKSELLRQFELGDKIRYIYRFKK